MNIDKYKKDRLTDVRYYLRGILFNDLQADKVVKGLNGNIDSIFNDKTVRGICDGKEVVRPNQYRIEVNKFLIKVRNAYDHLVADNLEFAITKQDVDDAIFEFELSLISIIKEFKNNIFTVFYTQTGYNSNVINNDVSFIRIKIREKSEAMALGVDGLRSKNELNGLRDIFLCIYSFMQMIKDKNIKEAQFLDMVNMTYKVGCPEYVAAMRKFFEIKNTRNYDTFIGIYNAGMDELVKPKGK